jgi:hypothetical protein
MPLPRGLVALCALWIAGSWLLCFGASPPLHATIEGYRPGVRLLVASIGVGVCAAWPLLRLSAGRERWPVRRVLVDLVTMGTMAQLVLWPLRLTTAWPPERMAAVNAMVLVWASLAGALVALTIGASRSRPRTLAMAGCLLITMIGVPAQLAAGALDLPAPPPWALGPVLGPLRLTETGAEIPETTCWPGIAMLAGLSGLSWGLTCWRLGRPGPVAPMSAHR